MQEPTQLDLLKGDRKLYERFYNFHKEHPEVYQMFEEYALQAIKSGLKHYGAKAIVEKIRWHKTVESRCADFFINNDFVSRMARMFVMKYPKHNDFFKLRKLRS